MAFVCASAALASPADAQTIDRAQLSRINHVVILGPPNPGECCVVSTEAGRGHFYFIPIPMGQTMIFVAGTTTIKTPFELKVEDSLHAEKIRLGQLMRNAIYNRLQAQGYRVDHKFVKKHPMNALARTYAWLDYEGDVYLDMAIFAAGLDDVNKDKALCPWMRVDVMVISWPSRKELVDHTYEYACESKFGGELISVDAKYRFKEHQVLADDTKLAKEAIVSGIDIVAERVTAMFQKSRPAP
jgi:hypothetical protein